MTPHEEHNLKEQKQHQETGLRFILGNIKYILILFVLFVGDSDLYDAIIYFLHSFR